MTQNVPYPEVGSIVRGRVVAFVKAGVLVELGNGRRGFLRRSQLSWRTKRAKASELLRIGEFIDVAVLDVQVRDRYHPFISLSRLPTLQNPWETIEALHPVGSRTAARVVTHRRCSVEVLFDSGFSAFVHDSEVSWTERFSKAAKHLPLGALVDVVILRIDRDGRFIAASFREACPNPWSTLLDRHPVGSVVTGTVQSVVNYGLFVKLPDGCTGLLHGSLAMPEFRALRPGMSLGVRIHAYDVAARRLSLAPADGALPPPAPALRAGTSPAPEGSAGP